MQTNYNEVDVLQQGAGKVTGARKFVKKVNIHMRDREMSGKMKRLKGKMEVQKITFNYFAWPQPRNWNFFMQWWWWWWWPYKKYCCPVSKFVVGVWDGLDESEISRPEILFQSAPGDIHKYLFTISTETLPNFEKEEKYSCVYLVLKSKVRFLIDWQLNWQFKLLHWCNRFLFQNAVLLNFLFIKESWKELSWFPLK